MRQEKRWTLEEHMQDFDKKLTALANMTEHHRLETSKSRARERHVTIQYILMLDDIIDSLLWDIGELRSSLDDRDSIFYIKDQKKRNEAWSEWVNLKLEIHKLIKKNKELEERLNTL